MTVFEGGKSGRILLEIFPRTTEDILFLESFQIVILSQMCVSRHLLPICVYFKFLLFLLGSDLYPIVIFQVKTMVIH